MINLLRWPILGTLVSLLNYCEALTGSVIIPCHHKHFGYLYPLLQNLEAQTRKPDDVVISLSGCEHMSKLSIKQFVAQRWSFPVTLLLNKFPCTRGGNRNLAAEHATGDVLICMDADDLSHPQRIEICLGLMEQDSWPDMVLHGTALSLDSDSSCYQYALALSEGAFMSQRYQLQPHYFHYQQEQPPAPYHIVTSGAPFLYREWFIKGHRWDPMAVGLEDVHFNQAFRDGGGKIALINEPLYYYRRSQSVGYNEREHRKLQQTYVKHKPRPIKSYNIPAKGAKAP